MVYLVSLFFPIAKTAEVKSKTVTIKRYISISSLVIGTGSDSFPFFRKAQNPEKPGAGSRVARDSRVLR